MIDLDIRCKGVVDGKACTAFLRIRPQATTITEVVCSVTKCKRVNQVKVCTSDSTMEQLRYKFPAQPEAV